MIPILYEATESEFLSLGIGKLIDCLLCLVTEERHGIFELSMSYPITGGHYSEIKNDRIILAKPNETMCDQPFRIYQISKPINGVVTISAQHISYDTLDIPLSPFEAYTTPEAVLGMMANSDVQNPFRFTTDKSTQGNFSIAVPVNFRSMLFGVQGSLLDVYGGEYMFDRWDIHLLESRGTDNGVKITYGKNLTDAKQDESIASVITGVKPYWIDGEGNYVDLPEKVIETEHSYSHPKIDILDMSSEFETQPTVAQLRAAAENYLKTTSKTAPTVNLTISFIPLWQTEEYKSHPVYSQIAGLEHVSLCDTVTVYFAELGIDTKAKVIKTVYDVLQERYQSIDIGEPRYTSLSRTVEIMQELEQAVDGTELADAIKRATDAITGATGGYVVLDPPLNPQRILIMDTDNKATAKRVWQWNLNGLGYSKNGINGPYELAMTMNGEIAANFITTGTLSANIIKAGILADRAGKNTINMDTGDVSMQGAFSSSANNRAMRLSSAALQFHGKEGSQIFGIKNYTLTNNSFEDGCEVAFYNSRGDKIGKIIPTWGTDGKVAQIIPSFSTYWVSKPNGEEGYLGTLGYVQEGSSYYSNLRVDKILNQSIEWKSITINGETFQVLAARR